MEYIEYYYFNKDYKKKENGNKAVRIIKEFIKEKHVVLGNSLNDINKERPVLLNNYELILNISRLARYKLNFYFFIKRYFILKILI